MGCAGRVVSLCVQLVLLVTVAIGLYLAYLWNYAIVYHNSRDFHAPHDRLSTVHILAEDFDILMRFKPELLKFERSMYERVAKGELPMKGKWVVLTGATKGLGRGIAAHLAAFGAQLVLPCRRCNFAEFKQQVASDAQQVFDKYKPKETKPMKVSTVEPHVFDMDLADLDRVDAFVDWYVASKFPAADLLINNAGLVSMDVIVTKQGFEQTFAVNYLASVLLTESMLEKKLVKGKIVAISSEDHRASKTIADTLKGERIKFGQVFGVRLLDSMPRYDFSKLLQTTYFLGLSRRIPNPVIELCPGPVASDISLNAVWPIGVIVKAVLDRIFVSPDQAAIPVLRLAIDERYATTTGKHFQLAEEKPARDDATDPKIQDQLFEMTAELLKRRAPPA